MMVRIDAAHTWAINGIGKDMYASAIVLAARMGLFGLGSMDRRLQSAHRSFDSFLRSRGKSSSIDIFNYMTLKCSKTPPKLAQHKF